MYMNRNRWIVKDGSDVFYQVVDENNNNIIANTYYKETAEQIIQEHNAALSLFNKEIAQ